MVLLLGEFRFWRLHQKIQMYRLGSKNQLRLKASVLNSLSKKFELHLSSSNGWAEEDGPAPHLSVWVVVVLLIQRSPFLMIISWILSSLHCH